MAGRGLSAPLIVQPARAGQRNLVLRRDSARNPDPFRVDSSLLLHQLIAESRKVWIELERTPPFGEAGHAVAGEDEQLAKRDMGVGVIGRHGQHEFVIKSR